MNGRRGAEERAALLQEQLDKAQLQQDASREALQIVQDGQHAAEEMAAVPQHQLGNAQLQQELGRAALQVAQEDKHTVAERAADLQRQLAEAQREQESCRAAQAGQQAAEDRATELKHRIKQLQRLGAHLLRQLDDSKAALQVAQDSKCAAEEKATDLQRQLGEAQRQQEADKEALQAAPESLLGQHATAHAQHQIDEARRLLPLAQHHIEKAGRLPQYALCKMWQCSAERESPEGASRAAEEKLADLQRQLDEAQARDALAKAQDLMRTGQNACRIIRAQRYTFEARLTCCEQAFLAQGGLILYSLRPGQQPQPRRGSQDPSVEPVDQIVDNGQVQGQILSLLDLFPSLPAAGREGAALQTAAQQPAQAAPQPQPAVAPSSGTEIAAAETLTAMQMGAA